MLKYRKYWLFLYIISFLRQLTSITDCVNENELIHFTKIIQLIKKISDEQNRKEHCWFNLRRGALSIDICEPKTSVGWGTISCLTENVSMDNTNRSATTDKIDNCMATRTAKPDPIMLCYLNIFKTSLFLMLEMVI